MPTLKSAPSTIDNGITSRGKRTLRSRFSRATSDCTEPPAISAKNWNSTIENRM